MFCPKRAEAGMQVGDTLTAINGKTLMDGAMLFEELGKTNVGEKINYTIERTNETGESVKREISVTGFADESDFSPMVSRFFDNLYLSSAVARNFLSARILCRFSASA